MKWADLARLPAACIPSSRSRSTPRSPAQGCTAATATWTWRSWQPAGAPWTRCRDRWAPWTANRWEMHPIRWATAVSCHLLICYFITGFQGDSSLILEQLAEIDMLTQEGDTNSVRKWLLLFGLWQIDRSFIFPDHWFESNFLSFVEFLLTSADLRKGNNATKKKNKPLAFSRLSSCKNGTKSRSAHFVTPASSEAPKRADDVWNILTLVQLGDCHLNHPESRFTWAGHNQLKESSF